MVREIKKQIKLSSQQILNVIEELLDFPQDTLAALGLDQGLESITNLLDLFPRLAEQHSALERERRRQQVAAEITRLIGQTLDFDKVARKALEATVGYLAGEDKKVVGTLQQLDHKAGELVDVAGVGYAAGREDVRVPLGQGVTGQVAETGQSLLIPDLTDERWKDIYIPVMVEEIRSELAVPLKRDGEVWGVLNVESSEVAAFDEDDRTLLETIAVQILIALRNAEQHSALERERRRLHVAAEITRQIGQTLDFDKVAHKALEATVDYLKGENKKIVGTLQQLDHKAGELVDVAGVGYAAGREDVRVPLGQGVTGQVAETGESLLIRDLYAEDWKDKYISVMAEEIRSELAVPLKRDGEVWGVLNVESPEVAAFDEDDKTLLETIAIQIKIALRNAEQYKELKEEQAGRIVAEEWSALSFAAAGLTHHLGNHLGIVPLNIRFIREIIENKEGVFTDSEFTDLIENLDTIKVNVDTAAGLINGLRQTYTGETPDVDMVDVNLIIKAALKMNKLAGMEIIQELSQNLPPVEADKSRLTEVIAELIRNAEKAMPSERGRLIVGSRHVDNFVDIWVTDNGRGIPLDEQEKVFRLFYRSDVEKPGYGIGLAGVRNRIRGLKGEVSLYSEGIGCGTTITIRLPAGRRRTE